MAKKTVATLHEGSKDGRAYTKVIKMVKSPKTGAYIFDEQMVPNEAVKDFFKYTALAAYCRRDVSKYKIKEIRGRKEICGLFFWLCRKLCLSLQSKILQYGIIWNF